MYVYRCYQLYDVIVVYGIVSSRPVLHRIMLHLPGIMLCCITLHYQHHTR